MRHANNEKQETKHDRIIRTIKSRKIRTLGEKETNKYLGILEANTIRHTEITKRIKKDNLRRTKKLLETKLYCRNLIKRDEHLGCPLRKILGTILKVDHTKTLKNESENKKTKGYA